ncbi:hypothetical protein L873DRAFT_1793030 [Choiromyces venosus 120613-1]|uniref:Uncharacterized protein n=1 Tax=Choiromyces venosus 120613-1 TaxID=1336337 RepID=A0A3N4J7V0_9PEZI|nr:hypothetical protein L873DRAFT_1793030 [Choiromyces venosus 120613-1]
MLDIKFSNDLSTSLALSFRPFTVNYDTRIIAVPTPPPSLSLLPSLAALGIEVEVEESESAVLPPPPPAPTTSTVTQTSLLTSTIASTPPPASLLHSYKVHQLDQIFTADRFYRYLLSAPSTSACVTTTDEFLSTFHGITGAEDCSVDLVVGVYDGMSELQRGMMAEAIKVAERGLEGMRTGGWMSGLRLGCRRF